MFPDKEEPTLGKPVSLHPLKFEEAVTDLLKVEPEPRPDKVKKRGKHRKGTSSHIADKR